MAVDRLDELIQELESSPDEDSRERTLLALRTVVEFYRGAFERLLEIVAEQGRPELTERLLADPLLASILRGYGLIGDDLEGKVCEALDSIRPLLQSHGGDVSLIGVSNKVAQLELLGSCHGCSASLITLKGIIERTLSERVPELAGVAVRGLTQTDAENSRRWLPLLHRFELQNPKEEFLKVRLFEDEVLACLVDQHAFVFKNRCPAGDAGLEKALRSGLYITCRCHGYRFDLRSGRDSEDPRLRLEVLPVRLSGDMVQVAL